jgi:hypothetical protein
VVKVHPQAKEQTMHYEITDAADERSLAEADGIDNARFAARTMHDEGEALPIIIWNDGREVLRLMSDVNTGRPTFVGTHGLTKTLS